MRRCVRLATMLLVLLVLIATAIGPFSVHSAESASRYFAPTGHTVQGDFLAFWEQHGGLSIFGYPVSAELWEDGRIVQYFERNRLSLHPENPAESRVQLAKLGIERLQASGRSWRTLQQVRPDDDPGCHFFSQTSHSLCGEFRQFWERNGGAVIFGDPISEPVSEVSETDGRTYVVQYFENVRLELHPENIAPHTILLGLLGRWRASWLLGPSRTASIFQAQISGPAQALAPLDPGSLQINAGEYRGPAELRLFDSAGRLEHTAIVELAGAPVEVPWQAGGALGAHPAVLLIDGAVAGIAGSAYQLDAETQIATGLPRYDSLPGRIREFLSNDVSEYEYQGYTVRGYRSPDSYLIWLRDHVYQGQGYRYFEPDMTSALDYFRREQKPDGAFDDYFAMRDANPVQGRIAVEADLEYLFVQGVYQAWQATGDDAWLAANIPAMERGIAYSTSDPIRWDPNRQLIRRPLTIDTWDFEYGGPTIAPDGKISPRHWIDEKSRFGVMHGDNTGMAYAMQLMSRISAEAGDVAAAATWAQRAAQLMDNLNNLAWNGQFFTHNVLEQPFDIPDVDEAAQLSLSNAYALNREVLSFEQARAIIDEYYRRRGTSPASISAEWYSIDPPFPAGVFGTSSGWGNVPGEYVNGGTMPLVGGELARGAFRWGQEAYGFDILQRYEQMITIQGGTYLWYSPVGNPGISGPDTLATDGWGSTAMLAALLEGAAGITDKGALYRDTIIAPRWPADPEVRQATVTTRYAASLGYVAYTWSRQERGLRLQITGSGRRAHLHILLPADAPEELQASVNGVPTRVLPRSQGASRYLDLTLTNPTATVAISW